MGTFWRNELCVSSILNTEEDEAFLLHIIHSFLFLTFLQGEMFE